MRSALRTIRLIQIAMMACIGVYVIVGETVHTHVSGVPTLLYALSVASISVVGALFVVRRTMVLQSEIQLRNRPDDAVIVSRWRAGYVVTFALSELLALFGLMLRLVGFPISQVWPYYLGGFVLLLLFWPRDLRDDG